MTSVAYALSLPSVSFLLQILSGATVILVLASAAALVLRRQSAAFRHRLWALSITAILVLPLFDMLLPDIGPEWLPGRSTVLDDPVTRRITVMDGAAATDRASNNFVNARERGTEGTADSAGDHLFLQSLNAGKTVTPAVSNSSAGAQPLSPTSQAPISAAVGIAKQFKVRTAELWLVGWWLTGCAVGLLALVRQGLAARGIARRAVAITDAGLTELKEHLRHCAPINADVRLLCSSEIAVPLTLGCAHPVIVLPLGYGRWTEELQRVVLAHEIAHIQRRDVLWQLLARTACVLYWCHPLVWFASWRMRIEREFACDDAVLNAGEIPARYAGQLVNIAGALLARRSRDNTYAVAMAGCCRLEERVRAVLNPRRNRSPVGRATGRAFLAVTLVVVIACSLAAPSASQEKNRGEETRSTAPEVEANSQFKQPATPQPTQSQQRARPSGTEAQVQQPTEPTVPVSGNVLNEAGQAVAGAVVSCYWPEGEASSRTDATGRFTLSIPKRRASVASLIARGPGQTLAYGQLPRQSPLPEKLTASEIILKAPRPLEVHVSARNGDMLKGIKIYVQARFATIAEGATDSDGRAKLLVPKDATLQFVFADGGGAGVDYQLFREPHAVKSDPYQLDQDYSGPISLTLSPTRTLKVRVEDRTGNPVAGAQVFPWYFELPEKGDMANLNYLFVKATGADGIVSYDNIPIEQVGQLTVWTTREGFVPSERLTIDVKTVEEIVTLTLLPLVPISGQVRNADGSPAKGVTVYASGQGYRADLYHEETVSAADGSFRLKAHPDTYCMFAAGDGKDWASPVATRVVRDQPIKDIVLILQPSTRIMGQLTAKDSGEPMADQYMYLYLKESEDDRGYRDLPKAMQLPNPQGSLTAILPRIVRIVRTDQEGRFAYSTGPGGYYLTGPRGMESSFVITDQEEIQIAVQADKPLEGTLNGRVVLATNRLEGVAEARVRGFRLSPSLDGYLDAVADADGEFETERSDSPLLVGAFSESDELAGIVRMGGRARTVEIPVGPTATFHGVLISELTGLPAPHEDIRASIRVQHDKSSYLNAFARSATTDELGRFTISGIVPGHEYCLEVITDLKPAGFASTLQDVGKFTADSAKIIELGNVRFRRP